MGQLMTRPAGRGGFYSFLGKVEMIPARGRWRRDGGKQRGRENHECFFNVFT